MPVVKTELWLFSDFSGMICLVETFCSCWVVGKVFENNFNLLEKVEVGSMMIFTSTCCTCAFVISTGWWWTAVCRFGFERFVGFVMLVRRSGVYYCVLVFKEVMYDIIFAGG